MKRKLKLLTSAFSLMLMVTLLVIGVYSSAVQRQVSLSGTITFELKNIAMDVEVYKAYGKIVDNDITTGFEKVGEIKYQFGKPQNQSETINLGNINLNDTQTTFKYLIKFKNQSSQTLFLQADEWTPTNGVQARYRLNENNIDPEMAFREITLDAYQSGYQQIEYSVNPLTASNFTVTFTDKFTVSYA